MLFINGIGAIAGPLTVGWMMGAFGANGFWLFSAILMLLVGVYAAYRMTRRSRADLDLEGVSYVPVSSSASPIMVEVAQEAYVEAELEEEAHSEA